MKISPRVMDKKKSSLLYIPRGTAFTKMNKLCTVSSFINTNFQFSARLSGWQAAETRRLETGSSPSRTLNPLSTRAGSYR